MPNKTNNNRKKTKINQDLFIISFLTLIAVAAWVASDAYHHFITKQAITIPENLLIPLNPKIDMEIINQLEEKGQLSEEEIEQILGTIPSPESTSPSRMEFPAEEETTAPSVIITPSPIPSSEENLPTENLEGLRQPDNQEEKLRFL